MTDDTQQMDIVEEVKKATLGDLANALETARSALHEAQREYETAGANVKAAVLAERAADKAFIDAVKESRPKRTPRKKKEPDANVTNIGDAKKEKAAGGKKK